MIPSVKSLDPGPQFVPSSRQTPWPLTNSAVVETTPEAKILVAVTLVKVALVPMSDVIVAKAAFKLVVVVFEPVAFVQMRPDAVALPN